MKCPNCGDNMEFNDITQTYNCIGCGKVIQKDNIIGEAISARKANNVLSRKLTTVVAGTTLVGFMGLAMLFARKFGNNNSINNKPNTNGTHTEAESDYNNNDDLSENEDTIYLKANPQYCAESGWTLSGSYQTKTIISQVPATVVKTTTVNRTYRIK